MAWLRTRSVTWSASEIQAAIDQQIDQADADRQAIQIMLQRADVRRIAGAAGLDLERASAAAAVLSGPALEKMAAQAREVNAEPRRRGQHGRHLGDRDHHHSADPHPAAELSTCAREIAACSWRLRGGGRSCLVRRRGRRRRHGRRRGAPERVRLLDVPYVPQSGALCGGAALAMVLRYWGRPGVLAEDFAALVEPGQAGIRTGALGGGRRGPRVDRASLAGNSGRGRDHLAQGRPVIALIRAGSDCLSLRGARGLGQRVGDRP